MRLILDGNNIAYRANVTSDLRMKNGEKVSALYGTLNTIHSYLKKSEGGWKNRVLNAIYDSGVERTSEFNEIIVCWDCGKSEFRKKVYPDYKGQREKKRMERTPEEKEEYYQFLDQMRVLHEILPIFGVKSLKLKGWEADDLIYASTKLVDSEELSIIVSTDRDMLQLVSDNIYVWSPYKEVLYTPYNFRELVGIPKESYLTYRMLVGDVSDNIDGIHGIGEKRAKDLISTYGDLNGIFSNKDKLLKSVVTRRIFETSYILERNKYLMDMTEIPFDDDVKKEILELINKEVSFKGDLAKAFVMSKQMVSIIKDWGSWAIRFKKLNSQGS